MVIRLTLHGDASPARKAICGKVPAAMHKSTQRCSRRPSVGVVYRRPLGDLVFRLGGEFGGQGGLVGLWLDRVGAGFGVEFAARSGGPRSASLCLARTTPTRRMRVRSGKTPTASVRLRNSFSAALADCSARSAARSQAGTQRTPAALPVRRRDARRPWGWHQVRRDDGSRP